MIKIHDAIPRILSILVLCVVGNCLCANPVIGISTDASGDNPDHAHLGVTSNYVDAITSAGGIPLLIPASLDLEAVPRYVELCDGFVMTGGRDIHPSRYGETTVSEKLDLMNPRREQFDFALIDAVLKADKPIVGICLGSQELNVALGGSLYQDIPSETSSTINHKPGGAQIVHDVTLTTGTHLRDIIGSSTLQVNSMHHQGCNRMAPDVLVAAQAPDDLVESFQVKNQDFALGIQWHPEALPDVPQQQKIYQALVKAAETNSRARR
jgi:putative glutamine amidotransferase